MLQFQKIFSFFIFVLCLFSFQISSHAKPLCAPELESVPILAGGRVKPLYVHAKEMVKFIYGKSSYQDLSPLQVYCQMSFQKMENQVYVNLPIQVTHVKTREFLKIPTDQKHISFAKAQEKLTQLQEHAQVLKGRGDKSNFFKDLQAVILRTQIYQDIVGGTNWQIPVSHSLQKDDDSGWVPLVSVKSFVEKQKGQNFSANTLLKMILDLGEKYTKTVGHKHLTELMYEKAHLFHWAILVSILALVITLVAKNVTNIWVILSTSLLVLVEIAAVTFRIIISQRGPVTNMYETVMWVGIGSLIFAIILAFLRKEKLFILGGVFLNLCCLFMMTFATDMLDPSIKPLVPVLRDNFWLSTHVTTITISYAAFALSWVLANYYMLRTSFAPSFTKQAAKISDLSYSAIKIGVVLLAAGIILGGVWADYSWGRFWGWDPKETWALIALMGYIVILHGRFTGWIPNRMFLPLIALAYMGVLMAWFGVNYILASGLHSYGFSDGGTFFLASIFALQIAIIILYFLRHKSSVKV